MIEIIFKVQYALFTMERTNHRVAPAELWRLGDLVTTKMPLLRSCGNRDINDSNNSNDSNICNDSDDRNTYNISNASNASDFKLRRSGMAKLKSVNGFISIAHPFSNPVHPVKFLHF
jgi:hypothetical protein